MFRKPGIKTDRDYADYFGAVMLDVADGHVALASAGKILHAGTAVRLQREFGFRYNALAAVMGQRFGSDIVMTR